jgi:anti-anti-sigma regulatory factor
MLALEMLRVQDERNAFDDLSIDYCVTFEVSPPSWEAMPENIREPSKADPATAGDAPAETPAGASAASAPTLEGRGFPLVGEVVGRIQKELAGLREYMETRQKVVVDCRRLVRLDFVAAGELLNETVTSKTSGKEITFVDVSAVVAALMCVMGIHELADIRRRKL